MEVQAGALRFQLVVDIDDNAVALGDIDCRERPLAVDTNGIATISSIRVGGDPSHVEIISYCGSVAAQCGSKQEEERTSHGGGESEGEGEGEGEGDGRGSNCDYPSYTGRDDSGEMAWDGLFGGRGVRPDARSGREGEERCVDRAQEGRSETDGD